MDESISSPFIRYPIATSLLMAGILFVGLVAGWLAGQIVRNFHALFGGA